MNIVTSNRIANGRDANYEYKKKRISLEELNMFARFPQGIPSHINIKSI